MSFFSQFPKVAYDFNRTGTVQQMVNIFRSVRSQSSILNKSTLYKKYTIQDGMRPDVVSEKLYGTPDYYWTFFIINDFLHDGLQTWPMPQAALQEYIQTQYSGKSLIFTPTSTFDDNRAEKLTKNSIAGKLELGGLVYGARSGAVGRIVRKDIDLNLIVIQDIIDGVRNRDPRSGQTNTNIEGGGFMETEYINSEYTTIDGATVTLGTGIIDSLVISEIYDYAEAPSYYYIKGDPHQNPVTSKTTIPTQFNQETPVYSEIQWNSELQQQVPNYSPEILNQTSLGTGNYIMTNTNSVNPLISSGGYEPTIDDPTAEIIFKSNRQCVIQKNEERSNIRVINPNHITEFVEEFERIINV